MRRDGADGPPEPPGPGRAGPDFDDYVPAMYGLLLRITGQRDLSDDLLQEALVKVWTRAAQFDGTKGSLRAWLLALVRNLTFDYLRSVRGRLSRNCSTDTPLERFLAIDNEARFHQPHLVADGHRSLPPHERKALELGYFYGYTQSEIAQIMDAPLGMLKSWMRSGLAHLREGLSPVLAEEAQTSQSALAALMLSRVVAF